MRTKAPNQKIFTNEKSITCDNMWYMHTHEGSRLWTGFLRLNYKTEDLYLECGIKGEQNIHANTSQLLRELKGKGKPR